MQNFLRIRMFIDVKLDNKASVQFNKKPLNRISNQIPKLKRKGKPNVDDRRTKIINQLVGIALHSGRKSIRSWDAYMNKDGYYGSF